MCHTTVGAGTYSYVITDANGCSGSVTVTVTQPSPIVINYNATPINCYGGTSEVFISATGGTGPYQGTGFVILTAGTHQITVVDANGCVQTIVITITQPPKVDGVRVDKLLRQLRILQQARIHVSLQIHMDVQELLREL